MTKQQRTQLLLSSLGVSTLLLILIASPESNKEAPSSQAPVIARSEGKAHITEIRAPGSVSPIPEASVKKAANQPHWKSQLEETLYRQSSGNLKRAEIEKVDSFDWKIGKAPIKVDSIIVKLEHAAGHRTSFRAIVDSSNGKILQTWDQPVIDEFGGKKSDIRIDSRYHND